MLALLCIDTETKRVRRYIRGAGSRILCTDEAELVSVSDLTVSELNDFRVGYFNRIPVLPSPPEVA